MAMANSRTKFDAIISSGGEKILDATFRSAHADDWELMYGLSHPFMETGNLVQRTCKLYESLVEDFYVIEIDRTVVACAGTRRFTDTAEIYNVVVAKDWQGFGLGRVLVASMLIVLYCQGYANAFIFTKTAEDWFARCGFTPMDPAELPAERLALVDVERNSTPMSRATVRAEDGVDALPQVTNLRVRYERHDVEHAWDGEVDSLLPFTEKRGIEVDSLCWGGVCGTCRTPLKRGTISYHLMPEVNLRDGEILLCIARPVTDLVLDL